MAAPSPPIDHAAWLEEHLADPAARALWNAGACGRAVACAVARHRVEQGLTQTALAERLGVTQTQVSRYEAGDHVPTLETLQRLSDGLAVAIDIAIRPRGAEPPEPPPAEGGFVEAADQLVIAVRPVPATS